MPSSNYAVLFSGNNDINIHGLVNHAQNAGYVDMAFGNASNGVPVDPSIVSAAIFQ